jgi:hypothetical protein
MITATDSKLHWNYFLALEQDLEKTSRYIEFCETNFDVFSIELAHLLFAAASEVDVLAKCICEIVKPEAPRENILHYQSVFSTAAALPANDAAHIPNIATMEILIPRYGMKFKPWENWFNKKTPNWWDSYNHVKHERNHYFNEATLKNALNAMGALLILNFHYCRLIYVRGLSDFSRLYAYSETYVARRLLRPESTLLRLPEDCYATVSERQSAYGR